MISLLKCLVERLQYLYNDPQAASPSWRSLYKRDTGDSCCISSSFCIPLLRTQSPTNTSGQLEAPEQGILGYVCSHTAFVRQKCVKCVLAWLRSPEHVRLLGLMPVMNRLMLQREGKESETDVHDWCVYSHAHVCLVCLHTPVLSDRLPSSISPSIGFFLSLSLHTDFPRILCLFFSLSIALSLRACLCPL